MPLQPDVRTPDLTGASFAEPPTGLGLAGTAHAPWREVILLGALTAFGSVGMDMYLPALPKVTHDLFTTPHLAQGTVSIFLFGLAFGQLFFGPLSDRLGRRTPLLIGIGLYIAASAACAVATSIQMMIGARLIQAIGACAGTVIPRAIVRDRYEDHEVLHVFSLLSLVFGVAPIVAPLVGGWVLGAAGWRWIFGVQGAFAAVMAACTGLFLPETRTQAQRAAARAERTLASYISLLGNARLIGLLLTSALSGAALFAYITASPEVVITLHHISPAHFGWVFGANSAALIAANQINARLARRVTGLVLLRAALLVATGFGLVLVITAWTDWGGLAGLLIPLFFIIGSLGFTQPNTSTAAMSVDRSRAGATAALLGAFFFGVGSLAGVATSLLHDGTARPMAIVIFTVLAASVVAFETLVARRSGRGEP